MKVQQKLAKLQEKCKMIERKEDAAEIIFLKMVFKNINNYRRVF